MRMLRISAVLVFLALGACSRPMVVRPTEPGDSPPHPVVVHRNGPKGGPPPTVHGPVASLGIPPGHYPPPGSCRIWIPGVPPGRQARPVPCAALGDVPLGAWVLHRPSSDRKVVEVTTFDESKPMVVVSVSWYDATTGAFLRAGTVN